MRMKVNVSSCAQVLDLISGAGVTNQTVTVEAPEICSVDVWTSVDQRVRVVVWLSITVVVVVQGTSLVVLFRGAMFGQCGRSGVFL